jgi:hypothetical protein
VTKLQDAFSKDVAGQKALVEFALERAAVMAEILKKEPENEAARKAKEDFEKLADGLADNVTHTASLILPLIRQGY